MTFKQAKELLNDMDFEHFYNQLNCTSENVLMGCMGRFITKPYWADNTFIIHKNELHKNKNYERVLWERIPETISVGHEKSRSNDDWIVIDRIPNGSVEVKFGEKGIWGKC